MGKYELSIYDIFEKVGKQLNISTKSKSFKNEKGLVYLISTVGSYKNMSHKLKYYVLLDEIHICELDSQNREKTYQKFLVERLDDNTEFKLLQI